MWMRANGVSDGQGIRQLTLTDETKKTGNHLGYRPMKLFNRDGGL
jgi:hypothetical protein